MGIVKRRSESLSLFLLCCLLLLSSPYSAEARNPRLSLTENQGFSGKNLVPRENVTIVSGDMLTLGTETLHDVSRQDTALKLVYHPLFALEHYREYIVSPDIVGVAAVPGTYTLTFTTEIIESDLNYRKAFVTSMKTLKEAYENGCGIDADIVDTAVIMKHLDIYFLTTNGYQSLSKKILDMNKPLSDFISGTFDVESGTITLVINALIFDGTLEGKKAFALEPLHTATQQRTLAIYDGNDNKSLSLTLAVGKQRNETGYPEETSCSLTYSGTGIPLGMVQNDAIKGGYSLGPSFRENQTYVLYEPVDIKMTDYNGDVSKPFRPARMSHGYVINEVPYGKIPFLPHQVYFTIYKSDFLNANGYGQSFVDALITDIASGTWKVEGAFKNRIAMFIKVSNRFLPLEQFKVVVYDDGSYDPELDLESQYLARLKNPKKDPAVLILTNLLVIDDFYARETPEYLSQVKQYVYEEEDEETGESIDKTIEYQEYFDGAADSVLNTTLVFGDAGKGHIPTTLSGGGCTVSGSEEPHWMSLTLACCFFMLPMYASFKKKRN